MPSSQPRRSSRRDVELFEQRRVFNNSSELGACGNMLFKSLKPEFSIVLCIGFVEVITWAVDGFVFT
ncbi:hypothetical protein P154DRAFT_151 [Amniculicola lignicola CBS 123094]|uniref:Uncharacterized protein n=1 Tax=Amniculicola lignicola CBS 123094 TaxID=1392246 RepID=A0A6A5X3X7_9PLEO|nr:hypothetical protein P154DRAFT_151 [Amniculicola lignicola CBS 123094]